VARMAVSALRWPGTATALARSSRLIHHSLVPSVACRCREPVRPTVSGWLRRPGRNSVRNSSMPAAATCPSSGAGALASRLAACWASQRWMASSTARRRRHQLTRWSPLLEKVQARDSGGVAVRMLRVRFRWARYQAASVSRSAGGVSRSRRGTAWPLVTIVAIQPRMAPMWPTRSAAFQPGQSCTGREQSDCATVRRSCPSAAVTVRMSNSDTAVCLSLGAGTADKPVPGRQGGRAARSLRRSAAGCTHHR